MDFFGNLLINSICVAILLVILLANWKNCRRGMFGPRLFQVIISVGIFMFVFDTLGRLDGATNVSVPTANAIGNFLLFTFNPIIAILWLIYVIYQIQGDANFIKKSGGLLLAYFAINVILVVLNLFFGFYYTIDSNNFYTRGSYYFISVIWTFIPIITAFVITFINRRNIDYRKYAAFLFFPLAPVIGTALTFVTYGYSIVLPSLLVAYLLVFISIQSDTINIDYLTGVFNRRYLEEALRKKINEANPLFAGVMLDIDGFKQINDTHGHLIGDRALVDFSRVLQKSVGINDIVARYGGDEFIIVVETKDINHLQETLNDIKANIETFNTRKIYPFILTASFGSAMYNPETKQNMEQFINSIDVLMYQDKKKHPQNSQAVF